VTDFAAIAVGFGVGFIAAWLCAMLRGDAEYTRLHERLLREMRRNADLRADLLRLQRREAVAAANMMQLSGALTHAAAQRVQPVQLGGDVLGRFSWN
jgi:hypothetical protein